MLQFRRLVDMNLKLHFVYFVTIIIKNGICHRTFARGFGKRERHFVCMKIFDQFGPFPGDAHKCVFKNVRIKARFYGSKYV